MIDPVCAITIQASTNVSTNVSSAGNDATMPIIKNTVLAAHTPQAVIISGIVENGLFNSIIKLGRFKSAKITADAKAKLNELASINRLSGSC